MVRRYCHLVVRRPKLFLILSVALLVACAFGAQYLTISSDYRVFFEEDNPHLLQLEAIEEVYEKVDAIYLVLAPESGNVFTPEFLAVLEEVTGEAWQTPAATRVDSITNFQHSYAIGDEVVIEPLVSSAADLTADEVARVRDIALNEPLMAKRLVSEYGHVAAVNIVVSLPEDGRAEQKAAVEHIRNLAHQIEKEHPDIKTYVSGNVVFSQSFSDYSTRDLATLTPLMYVVICILIGILLRSIAATFAAISVIIFSVASAVGAAAWIGWNFTPVSATMPTIVLTLAVADSVHILSSVLYEMRHGRHKRDALIHGLHINFVPVTVTSVTTCIGFLSMNFSGIPPLMEFGSMTAIGVMMAYIYSLTLLPAVMALLPVRVKTNVERQRMDFSGLAAFVIRRRIPIIAAAGVMAAVFGAFVFRNEFENNFTNYLSQGTEFKKDVDFIAENLTGVNEVHFSVGSGEPDGITNVAYLSKLGEFVEWLEKQDGVQHVSSIVHVLRRISKNMHAGDPDYYRIPGNREMAAQYLLLYEMSLPAGLDLTNQISVDKSATRVTAVMENSGATKSREFGLRAEKWLRDNAPPAIHTHGAGVSITFATIVFDTIRSMVIGTPMALTFVSLTLIVTLGSVRYGLLSMIPNLAPILFAFGAWGLLVGKINFAVACVAGIAIGIVVDDSVHFMTKYLHGRRDKGYETEEAVRYAFASVGRAMGVTSFVLIIGFLLFMLSSFQFNVSMGILAAMTIAFAFVTDIFLLPALLVQFDHARSEAAEGIDPELPEEDSEQQIA